MEVISDKADRIVKFIDPDFTMCECCREFKTEEDFIICNSDASPSKSCFAGYRRIMTCDECKGDFTEGLKKRDKNKKEFGN